MIACKKVGIKPFQLKPISLTTMINQSSTVDIAKIRYDYQESKRLDLIKLVLDLKSKLDNCNNANPAVQENIYQLNSTMPNKNRRRSMESKSEKSAIGLQGDMQKNGKKTINPKSSSNECDLASPQNSESNSLKPVQSQNQLENNDKLYNTLVNSSNSNALQMSEAGPSKFNK